MVEQLHILINLMQFEGRLQSKESILCWNQLPQAKQTTVVGLRERKFDDNNGNEDSEVIPCTLSNNTLRNLVDAITVHRVQTLEEVLSLYARHYKRSKLKELVPGLTDFCIKEARKHYSEHGPGVPTLETRIHRFFFSETQVEHFLRFIVKGDVVSQDAAYGTSAIKLESGEELLVPKPVLEDLR